MKKRISDGLDVPEFFRDLVAMITDVPEEKWATSKDPSSRLTKESTLRSYAKRGLTAKFAQGISYSLKRKMFIESLNSRGEDVPKLLAEDYKGYDNTATTINIAGKLADYFIEIIRTAAGTVSQSELERQKFLKQALELKLKYEE